MFCPKSTNYWTSIFQRFVCLPPWFFIVRIAAIFMHTAFSILFSSFSLIPFYVGASLVSLFSWPVDIFLHHWHWLHTSVQGLSSLWHHQVARIVAVELGIRLVWHHCIHLLVWCVLGTYLMVFSLVSWGSRTYVSKKLGSNFFIVTGVKDFLCTFVSNVHLLRLI